MQYKKLGIWNQIELSLESKQDQLLDVGPLIKFNSPESISLSIVLSCFSPV